MRMILKNLKKQAKRKKNSKKKKNKKKKQPLIECGLDWV
jgi:hypothetical protein